MNDLLRAGRPNAFGRVDKLPGLVRTSKFGLGLLAIREDEDAAEVMGVIAPNAKTWAYVLSAIFPGLLGVLFFFKNINIEPAPAFRLQLSIEMIVMVMVVLMIDEMS